MTSAEELIKQRDVWLLELKLALQKVIRDKGKCIGFGSWGKKNWLPYDDSIAFVYTSGDIVWCWMNTDGKSPNLIPGVHNSVFSQSSGVPIPFLLEWLKKWE